MERVSVLSETASGCPSDDDAAGFVAGALSAELRSEVVDHLDRCARCRRRISALAAAGDATQDAGAAPGGDAELHAGQVLGRFVLTRKLGHGSMAEVWAARDRELDREVALKLLRLRPGVLAAEATVRLRREAQAMARLNHPNVVAIYELGSDHGDRVFCAMELVDGPTLRRWLETPRSWREVLGVACAVARGIAAAHAVGLIHRDIKPENILIAPGGRTLVSDFGLARLADLASASDDAAGRDAAAQIASAEIDALTLTGTVIGTPLYMAPEQLAGHRAEAQSDQFAYCVTVHEALFGARPFTGRTVHELTESIRRGPPRRSRRAVPVRVVRCLERGLAFDPAARWPSMAALLDELERAARPRRRWPAVVVAGAALAAAAGALVVSRAPDPYTAARIAAEQRIAGAWNPGKAAVLRARFAATGAPHAHERAATTIRALDGYRAAWAAQRIDMWTATHVRGDQAADVLERRLACLDYLARAMNGLVGLFLAAGPADVQRAPDSVRHLAPIATCSNPARLKPPGEQARPGAPLVRLDDGALHPIAVRRAQALQRKYHSATCPQAPAASCAALLGEPVVEELAIAGGMVSYFAGQVCNDGHPVSGDVERGGRGLVSGSAIYDGPGAGAYEVHGCIYQLYADALGGPDGPLGFPISDEYEIPQGRESDFQYGSITFDASTGTVEVHLGEGRPSAAPGGADGRLDVFAWGGDGTLSHRWLAAGAWSAWTSRGGNLSGRPAVIRTADARLEVFARGASNALYHTWQRSPGGSWSGWASLGGPHRGEPAIVRHADGRLEVLVRGTDDVLHHCWQHAADRGDWSGWVALGGALTSAPAAILDRDDRLHVFARGAQGDLQYRRELATGGWSAWASLGGELAGDPVVQRTADGRLEVFARGRDAALWHLAQRAADGDWSAWASLGGSLPGAPAVIAAPDGRLEVFARGSDDALWHVAQRAPGGDWSAWASLGGSLGGDPDVQPGRDGELEVVAPAGDSGYLERHGRAGDWSAWRPL